MEVLSRFSIPRAGGKTASFLRNEFSIFHSEVPAFSAAPKLAKSPVYSAKPSKQPRYRRPWRTAGVGEPGLTYQGQERMSLFETQGDSRLPDNQTQKVSRARHQSHTAVDDASPTDD